jgi:hypothetical protein
MTGEQADELVRAGSVPTIAAGAAPSAKATG